jgi:hypothetical protein
LTSSRRLNNPGVEAGAEVFVGSESHKGVSKRVSLPCPGKALFFKGWVAPFQYIIKEFLSDIPGL